MTTERKKWYDKYNATAKARARRSVYKKSDKGKAAAKRYNAKHAVKRKYLTHRGNAKQRGIEFLFTFDEWVAWWGVDLDKRGPGKLDLCMCRHGDKGPYHVDNVFKQTRAQNAADARHG